MVTATVEAPEAPKTTKAKAVKPTVRGPRFVPEFLSKRGPKMVSACYADFRDSQTRRHAHASFDDYAAGWVDSFDANWAGKRKRKGEQLGAKSAEHMAEHTNGVTVVG